MPALIEKEWSQSPRHRAGMYRIHSGLSAVLLESLVGASAALKVLRYKWQKF